jgi:uncharacterized protein
VSEKVLHIASDLTLDAQEFLSAATGIVGKRGRGKSGAVKRIMEELHRVHLPFVVFDPAGIHWAVRSSGDGKKPGLSGIVVIGGAHADIRLDRRAGAMVARNVVEANVSCVIDFKSEPHAAYREFIRDFSEELFRIENAPPRVVIIEEAPRLVPQKLYPGMQECYAAVEKLVSQGRNEGVGVVLVGQRVATMSKDVLSEVDILMIFGLVSKHDRRAVADWVETHDDDEKLAEFDSGLPGLQRQECWVWAPELGIFRKIRVLPFHTLHGDKTHLRKLGLLEAKPVVTDVTTVLAKLGKQMELLSKEKTEVARIPRLEAEIRRLTAELARRTVPGPSRDGTSAADTKKAVDAATAPLRSEREAYRRALTEANTRLRKWNAMAASAWDAISKYRGEGGPVDLPGTVGGTAGTPPAPRTVISERSRPTPKPAMPLPSTPQHYPEPPAVPEDDGGVHLKAGAVRMLRELASRHPLTLTYAQLATLAGFTPSGGTAGTYFSVLKRAGYLAEDGAGNVSVTEEGRAFLGADVPPAPSSHAEVMARWAKVLKAGTYKMLETVVARHPEPISREDLGAESGFAVTGGTFGTYLGILARNGLVEVDGPTVKAAGILWP